MPSFSQNQIKLPKGLLKLGYKLPVWFYRLRLGALMGSHVVYVEHTGRKSGVLRRSVLEVIRIDEEGDRYLVASGYGTRSDWYKNIKKNPNIFIQVAFRRTNAQAVFLSEAESQAEILDYAQRHPKMLKILGGMIGYSMEDGGPEEIEALSKVVPVIAFVPSS